MSKYPAYKSPLVIPDIDVGQPIQLPKKTGGSESSKSSSKENKVEGLTGDVSSYYQTMDYLKNKMTEIMGQYGIGNMSYAEKYDKEYQAVKAEYNRLSSPSIFNEMDRRKTIKEGLSKKVQSKDAGEEIDVDFFENTGKLRTYNTLINSMEYGGLNYEFDNIGESPNLTTYLEAEKMLLDRYQNAQGYNSNKAMDVSGVTGREYRDGKLVEINQKTTGGSSGSNRRALNAVQSDIVGGGVKGKDGKTTSDGTNALGTDIRAGLTRGFLESNLFYQVLEKFNGEGRIQETEAYQEAFQKFVNNRITNAYNKALKTESDQGGVEYTSKYVDIGDNNVNKRVSTNALKLFMNTYNAGNAYYIAGGDPQEVRDANAYPSKAGQNYGPANSLGHRRKAPTGVLAYVETKNMLTPFLKDIGYGNVSEDQPIELSKVVNGTYVMQNDNGTYWRNNQLNGWEAVDIGTSAEHGDFKPLPNIEWMTDADGNKLPARVSYGSFSPNGTGGRTIDQIEEYNKLAKEISATNPKLAAQLHSNGMIIGVRSRMGIDEFLEWGKKTYVPISAHYTEGIIPQDIDKEELTRYIKNVWAKNHYVQPDQLKVDFLGVHKTGWKGAREVHGFVTSTSGNRAHWRLNDVAKEFLEWKAGDRSENVGTNYDYVTKGSLLVNSSKEGYTQFGETGYYIAIEHAPLYETKATDDGTYIYTTFDMGAESILMSTPEAADVIQNSILQSDYKKSQALEKGINFSQSLPK